MHHLTSPAPAMNNDIVYWFYDGIYHIEQHNPGINFHDEFKNCRIIVVKPFYMEEKKVKINMVVNNIEWTIMIFDTLFVIKLAKPEILNEEGSSIRLEIDFLPRVAMADPFESTHYVFTKGNCHQFISLNLQIFGETLILPIKLTVHQALIRSICFPDTNSFLFDSTSYQNIRLRTLNGWVVANGHILYEHCDKVKRMLTASNGLVYCNNAMIDICQDTATESVDKESIITFLRCLYPITRTPIDAENVTEVLIISQLIECQSLMKQAEDFIIYHFEQEFNFFQKENMTKCMKKRGWTDDDVSQLNVYKRLTRVARNSFLKYFKSL